MAMESRALHMQAAQRADSAQVLARAFFDDPMMVYLMPNEGQRRDILPDFMDAGMRICENDGEVYTTPGAVLGNACWLPPGRTEINDERMAAAGGLDVIGRMDDGGERFGALMAHMGELHEKAVPPEHWYLLILGVDPPRQGQGVGGSLVAPVLARADAERRPCYLETMKERNVAFYQKQGFEVVVDDVIPGGDLRFWTMRRDPR